MNTLFSGQCCNLKCTCISYNTHRSTCITQSKSIIFGQLKGNTYHKLIIFFLLQNSEAEATQFHCDELLVSCTPTKLKIFKCVKTINKVQYMHETQLIESTPDNSYLLLTRIKIDFPWIHTCTFFCHFTPGNLKPLYYSNLPLT